MPARAYIPKFKTGQTVISRIDNDEYLIVFSYSGLVDLSCYGYELAAEYDERNIAHTVYCCIQQGNHSRVAPNWLFEEGLELYCSNANRGKMILLESKNITNITEWYKIQGEKYNKFIAMLQPSTET